MLFFLLSISPVSFPQGISPKVEFSTTSIIEECDVKHGQPAMSVSLWTFVIVIILQLVLAPFQKLASCLRRQLPFKAPGFWNDRMMLPLVMFWNRAIIRDPK